MVSLRFALVPIRDLKTHELAEPMRVKRVMHQIESSGVVKKAIAVDAKTMVVLDGVHRLTALEMLGCVRAPAWLVDYSDEEIVVFSKGRKSIVPKSVVLNAATVGPKLPPKSTRHMVKLQDGTLVHISKLGEEISVPLATLRERARLG